MKHIILSLFAAAVSIFSVNAQDLDGTWELYLEGDLVKKSESLALRPDQKSKCFGGSYSVEWNDADWQLIKKSDVDVQLECLGGGLYRVQPSEGQAFHVKFMGNSGPKDYLLLCDPQGKPVEVHLNGEASEQRFVRNDEMEYGVYPADGYGEEGMFESEGAYGEEGLVIAKAESTERYFNWGKRPSGDGPNGWIYSVVDHPLQVTAASAELPAQGIYSFGIEKVTDDDPTTAWVPDPKGLKNYPNGTFIEFDGPVYNEAIWILNGYQFSNKIFDANGRIKRMALYVNGTYWFDVELLDVMGVQKIPLSGIDIEMDDKGSVKIRLEVMELYPGKEYPEYGISGVFTRGG